MAGDVTAGAGSEPLTFGSVETYLSEGPIDTGGEGADRRLMSTLAPRRRRWMRRLGGAVETLREIGAFVYGLVWFVAVACLVLMGLGLGVDGLSKLLGTPLPMVDDDPNRIELGGLALLSLYGCIGVAALSGCYLVGRRLLGAGARAHVARALGTLALLGLAVTAAVVAVDDQDLRAVCFALFVGVGATRVARGLSFDQEDDSDDQELALPASFDTPVKIEEPRTRVETWTPPPRRPGG